LDLLTGLWSYGGFKLTESGYNQIFSTPERQNYASDPENFSRCKNVLQVLYYRAKFGGARISPADRAAKNDEFLSICLFVHHAFERQRLYARFRHEGVGMH